MLKHPAVISDSSKSSGKASAIFTKTELMGVVRGSVPIPTPSLAWRMGDYRMRSFVCPGVPVFVPRVNPIDTEIRAICFYIQSGNCL